MRLRSAVQVALCCLVLGSGAAGCGGEDGPLPARSGVDRSKYMDELSAAEIKQYCAWSTQVIPAGRHECSRGVIVFGTEKDCIGSQAHCLVSVEEDCRASMRDDACQLFDGEPCKAYWECRLAE